MGTDRVSKNAFYDLVWRGNILTRNFNGKTIILYEDHRYLLNVLYYARIKGILKQIPNLIFFDQHDDALPPGKYLTQKIQNFGKLLPSLADFWNFTEFNLSPYDDNWLLSGMEMGLLQNALLLGGQELTQINDTQIYEDYQNQYHHLINGGSINLKKITKANTWDTLLEAGFHHLTQLFKNQKSSAKASAYLQGVKPFILDFDLDCFSVKKENKVQGLSENAFLEKTRDMLPGCNLSPLDIIKTLARQATFITIARESDYCGGLRESFNNLSLLDKYVFEGKIMNNR